MFSLCQIQVFFRDQTAVPTKNCLKISSPTRFLHNPLLQPLWSPYKEDCTPCKDEERRGGLQRAGCGPEPAGASRSSHHTFTCTAPTHHCRGRSPTQRTVIQIKTDKSLLRRRVMKKKSWLTAFSDTKENNYVSYFKCRNAEGFEVTHLTIGNDKRRGNACFPIASFLIISLCVID